MSDNNQRGSMNMGPQNPQSKKSATQRLEDLENAVMNLYNVANGLARDLYISKEALKLLGNKTDSVVKCINKGSTLTAENISAAMVENNIEELKNVVESYVKMGACAPTDIVANDSFLVVREIAKDGSVADPRAQFTLASLENKEVATKLLGAKVGDVVPTYEGKHSIEVLEIYKVAAPQAAPEQEAPQAQQ